MFPGPSTNTGHIALNSLPVSPLSSLTVTMWVKPESCSDTQILLAYSNCNFENEILFNIEESVAFCKWRISMKDVEYVCFCCFEDDLNGPSV